MSRDQLKWESNNSLTYPLRDDGRVLRYFENWQQLMLEMRDFEISDFETPFDYKLRLAEIPGEDWRSITTEGRTKYFQYRKTEIKAGMQGGRMIIGKARIIKSEIEVGGVSGGFPRNEGDPAFRMSYSELDVYIQSADDDRYGEVRFSHAYEEVPASLYLTLYVRRDRMNQLVETILRSTRAPRLHLTVRALLFQDEVERSLNPTWAKDTYFLPDYPGATPAVPISVTAKYAVAAPRPADEDDNFVEQIEVAELVPSTTTLNPQAMHLLKRISQALWVSIGMVAILLIITRFF